MKSSILLAQQNQLLPMIHMHERLAKRIIFSKLENIKMGHLRIIDNEQVFDFGDTDECELKAVITVLNPSFYSSVAFGGSVSSGESYFLGDWNCDNLTNLVRLLLINRDVIDNIDNGINLIQKSANKIYHWLNRNTQKGSQRNISSHYDIGNELFKLMLDKSMMYSAAVYNNTQCTLEQASVNKLDIICRKLNLIKSDHLLEIGTGWGGMAIHAAKHYGCKVTTTTISQQQYDYAKQRIIEEGLDDKITLLFKDYRDLEGHYDKLVSIEMIEAVGLNNLDIYFEKCSSLLKNNGIMCLQSITIADQRFEQAKREVDFIQKYIFPGGSLPSITIMSETIMKHTDMHIFDLEDIGPHYARTLKDWRERFFQNESKIRQLGYDETFIRLWEFYLCYCEGGFMERSISTVHLLLTKPECRRRPLSYNGQLGIH